MLLSSGSNPSLHPNSTADSTNNGFPQHRRILQVDQARNHHLDLAVQKQIQKRIKRLPPERRFTHREQSQNISKYPPNII